MNTFALTAATLHPKAISFYLSIINLNNNLMSDFDSILKAEGLDLENVVFEISETTVVFNKKTTIGKSKSAPKRSPEDPGLEPEEMDIVEVTTEKSDTHTFSKKATAPKAKPAPKN